MRLLYWGLFFMLVLFGSVAGVAASFNNLALVAVFAFLFLIGIVGLAVTGLVYMVHAIQFGRREAYGRPSVTQRGEVVRSNSERVIADYFSRNGIRFAYEHPAMSRWGVQEDKQAGLLPPRLQRLRRVLGPGQPSEQLRQIDVRAEHEVEDSAVPPKRDKIRLAIPQRAR